MKVWRWLGLTQTMNLIPEIRMILSWSAYCLIEIRSR